MMDDGLENFFFTPPLNNDGDCCASNIISHTFFEPFNFYHTSCTFGINQIDFFISAGFFVGEFYHENISVSHEARRRSFQLVLHQLFRHSYMKRFT